MLSLYTHTTYICVCVLGLENDRYIYILYIILFDVGPPWRQGTAHVLPAGRTIILTIYCVALAASPTMDQGRVRYRSARGAYNII